MYIYRPQLHNEQVKKQLEIEQVQHSLDIEKNGLEQRKMVSKYSEMQGVNHSQYMLSSLVVKTDPVGSYVLHVCVCKLGLDDKHV